MQAVKATPRQRYQRAALRHGRRGRGPWRVPPPAPPEQPVSLRRWLALPPAIRVEAVRALRKYDADLLAQAAEHAFRDPAGWPAFVGALSAPQAKSTLSRYVGTTQTFDWGTNAAAAVAVAAGLWVDPVMVGVEVLA